MLKFTHLVTETDSTGVVSCVSIRTVDEPLTLRSNEQAYSQMEFLERKPYKESALVREVGLDIGWLKAGVIS